MSGRCLHFMGLLPKTWDAMTSNKCLKYDHPNEPQNAYMYEWFDLNHPFFELQTLRHHYDFAT